MNPAEALRAALDGRGADLGDQLLHEAKKAVPRLVSHGLVNREVLHAVPFDYLLNKISLTYGEAFAIKKAFPTSPNAPQGETTDLAAPKQWIWGFKSYQTAYTGFHEQFRADKAKDDIADAYRSYLKDLWSIFSIVNVLLVSTSITPFITPLEQDKLPACEWTLGANGTATLANQFQSYRQAYGALWSVAIGFNSVALLVSCLLMGSVLAFPPTADKMELFWTDVKYYTLAPLYCTAAGAVSILCALAFSAGIMHCWPGVAAAMVIFVVVLIVVLLFFVKSKQ